MDRLVYKKETILDLLHDSDKEWFVGREPEIQMFREFIQDKDRAKRIFAVHGIGGIGKSCLLDRYREFVEKKGARFIAIDSRGFLHTPDHLCKQILFSLKERTADTADASNLVDVCCQKLNEHSERRLYVLAFDTYEELTDMDYWLREQFIPCLSSQILIVIAGRLPLPLNWRSSPSWRKFILEIQLSELNEDHVCRYLQYNGIHDLNLQRKIQHFAKGHPLTLSLLLSVIEKDDASDFSLDDSNSLHDSLVEHWLREAADDQLLLLIEAAAITRYFHQELLEYVLNRPVSASEFQSLISLSFIRSYQGRWVFHDLVKQAIEQFTRNKKPAQYEEQSGRCAKYYFHQIRKKTGGPHSYEEDWYQMMYHTRDPFFQAAYKVPEYHPSPFRVVEVDTSNLAEAQAYRDKRIKMNDEQSVEFCHLSTGGLNIPSYFINKNFQLLDLDGLHRIHPNSVRIIKNGHEETVGMTAVIPLNKATLPYLSTSAVTGHFFQSRHFEQLKTHYRDGSEVLYFRMMETEDIEDPYARSKMLRIFLSYLQQDRIIVWSSPVVDSQHAMRWLQFEEIPDLIHYDYGTELPANTFVLDLRGERFVQYIRNWLKKSGISTKENSYGFRPRENEVLELLTQCFSNKEICDRLYISEITVKKHISSILRKTNTKNRTQLLKKITIH
jgi:DNA-binding CsgD family transcriptional regulator